jgi:hypothetical protein
LSDVTFDEARMHTVTLHVRLPIAPDLTVVDVLARLELVARRLGGRVEVAADTPELTELLELVGLRTAD